MATHYFVQLETGQELEIIQDQDEQEIIADGTAIVLTVKQHKINVFSSESKATLIRGGRA